MTPIDTARELRIPPAPTRTKRAPFPLLAATTPVVLAVMIWAVTHSPFALLFAALGPMAAAASVVDSAVSGRRNDRRESKLYGERLLMLESRIAERHSAERREAWAEHPSAMDALLAGRDDPARWRSDTLGTVVAGSGPQPSALRMGGEAADELGAGTRLRSTASMVDDMPVVLPVAGGIGVAGPPALARAVVRGLVLQICSVSRPDAVRIVLPEGGQWDWARGLPHVDGGGTALRIIEAGPLPSVPSVRDDEVLLAVAGSIAMLPARCAVFLEVSSATDLRIRRPGGRHDERLMPELVGEEQAIVHAQLLARSAEAAGRRGLPEHVPFRSLAQGGRGLDCTIGVGETGPVRLDLVADGPHAVIAGTTGSGKSELLVAWVAGMASGRTPAEFSFVLVDFKGGATGAQLRGLPHCAGIVSDLDGRSAERAFAGLSAEVLRREAVLGAAGERAVTESGAAGLGRLVVVVDEFQALVGTSPELHALFVDLAARGRSLGIHLILCTQRPSGIVRDALLANCALRISLRVNDAADSVAVVGSARAASLKRSTPGRCVIAHPDGAIEVQTALADTADVTAIALGAADGGPAPRCAPVWLDPLPVEVRRDEAAALVAGDGDGTGILLGVVDEPENQRRAALRWDPQQSGHLAVVGSARSGTTSLLAAIAEQCERALPVTADPEALWDLLHSSPTRLDGAVLLIDDWDAVAAAFEIEHRSAAADRLTAVMRAGRTTVVVASRRPAALGFLGPLLRSTLVLRLDDRADHVQAGAPARLWDGRAVPGRGCWEGHVVQTVLPDVLPAAPQRKAIRCLSELGGPIAVVARIPAQTSTRLRAAGREARGFQDAVGAGSGNAVGISAELALGSQSSRSAIVGDVDSWMARPALLAGLRARIPVLFDGCNAVDFRSITRMRELPPALADLPGRGWVLMPDGTVERVITDR